MGMYCEVSVASADDIKNGNFEEFRALPGTTTATAVSLEKSWHGLHYLLTGEAWQGNGPLAFLLAGGEEVGEDEESPLRWFTPAETVEIEQALGTVTDEELWARFDAEKMASLDIYPGIWDEVAEELEEEYLHYFHALQEVVAAAAEQRQGLLVSLG